jgi:uncharacterized delta-60 repeat protein
MVIARYNYDGSPDNNFDNDGFQAVNTIEGDVAEAVAVQGDKIVVASNLFTIFRFNSDGTPDHTFGQDGIRPTHFPSYSSPIAKTLLIQNDKITATGTGMEKGKFGFAVARYNNNGSLDNTFGNGGLLANNFPSNYGIVNTGTPQLEKNGKILFAGTFFNKNINAIEFAIARYNPDGSIDNSFSDDGVQTTPVGPGILENIMMGHNRLYAIGNTRLNEYRTKGIVVAYQLVENVITLSCPPDTVVPNGKGECTALVNGIDPVFTGGNSLKVLHTLTGAATTTGIGTVNGKIFNIGETVVTYTDATAPGTSCSFKVTVEDKEAPIINNISASPNTIWPPNHKMREVKINYLASDNCGRVSTRLSVKSNDNSSDIDWQVINSNTVNLRAERSKKKFSRIYTITIIATDDAGNQSQQQVDVTVPHDNSTTKKSNLEIITLNTKDKTEGNKILNELVVSVMPNPSQQDFNLIITSKSNQLLSLVILDASGRIIETKRNIAPNTTLSFGREYKAGYYQAQIQQGHKKATVKLIKLPG